MTPKAVIGAFILASVIALAATAGTPEIPGWIMAGSQPTAYEMGIAPGAGPDRKAAAYLKSKQDSISGFGTMMQMFDASDYRGKRVRFSANVKTENVRKWSGLWMRVDGEKGSIAFDNMGNRPIKGTTGWQRYEVVLDVAPEAQRVALGILVDDTGTAWLADVRFEVVPDSAPVTSKANDLPKAPRNLGFSGS